MPWPPSSHPSRFRPISWNAPGVPWSGCSPYARRGTAMPAAPPLIDTFHRTHDNLRLSVTDHCNIRCAYCMPESGARFAGPVEILSFEELGRFVRIAVALGVTKLRVTGGEPLLRPHLPALILQLAAIEGLREVALTTNAVLLEEQAASLYRAGL